MSAKAFCVEFVWGLNFGLNLFVGLNLELNLWACRFELGKGLEFWTLSF